MTRKKLCSKLAHGIVEHFEQKCPYALSNDMRSILVGNATWACNAAYAAGVEHERTKRKEKKR